MEPTEEQQEDHQRLPEPRVSVIIPTYNRAGTLARAVNSVLKGAYREVEVLVIDDGSNDETQTILKGIRDTRLRAFQLEERRGASAARNFGILRARGRWIAFQDSDDEWQPDKLARQAPVMEQSSAEVGVVYSNYMRAESGKARAGISRWRVLLSRLPFPRYRLAGDLTMALARGNFITTQSALVRKDALEAVGGFDEGLPRLQDWDLWLRMASKYSFAFIDQPLVTIYITPGRISSRTEALIPAYERIMGKCEAGTPGYGALRAQYHFAQADILLHQGETSSGLGHLMEALRLEPGNLAYWCAACAAMLGVNVYRRWMGTVGLSYSE